MTPPIRTENISIDAHPLAPLSEEEILEFREILDELGFLGPRTRFAYVALREPEKTDLADRARWPLLAREVSALLGDTPHGPLVDVVVDLRTRRLVEHIHLDPNTDGQLPAQDDDLAIAVQLVKSDARWRDAMRRRGVEDYDGVVIVPLSAGVYGYSDEVGIRAARALAFRRSYPTDNVWAHPIDGVVAHLDLTNKRVLRVVETDHVAIPAESGDYLHADVRGPLRTSQRPIEITQPEGVSFTLDESCLTWENWKIRVGFTGREGLVLHQVSFTDAGVDRPVLNRASISEMVVNYADPSPTHAWQNYFDAGEYQMGRLANSLKLGCDCLGEIRYVDAVVADDFGNPQHIPNAICIHEEDVGILWKHQDMFSGSRETRRQRRLVVSFFVTVGNYDYGFYWYFYLDGTISLECKATGIVFTSGHPGDEYPFATELAPGLGAPVHQHLFCARLDMAVDGDDNVVREHEIERMATGPTNPWGNAIRRRVTELKSEAQAVRDADNTMGRVWSIASASKRNYLDKPTSYVLLPEGQPTLLSADDSSAARRAAFAKHHLWVTRYRRDQLWAAGRVVNQHPGGGGLPEYVARDESLEGEDLVVWHTFGLTHFPRTEDWPVMPVDVAGFTLKPDGFFDRNPTLDVPAQELSAGHTTCGDTASCGCGCAHDA
ncbi:MAG: primary-amine oxidase [Actinomycetota bacterium]|nr:primary-amine oxidase [Actinomycetota bacterium]